jgi:hypothetical protein
LSLVPENEGIALTNLTGHPNATWLDDQALAPNSKHTALVTAGQTIKLPDGTLIIFKNTGTAEDA